MKKIVLVLLIVIIAACGGLWWSGKDTRTVTTEIEIAATPDQVWSALVNINEWQNWSPIIKASVGDAALGSKLTITMISEEGKDGKPGPKYEPVITIFETAKNLTWTATMGLGFVMTNGKVLMLEKTEVGTRLTHQETFSGLMVPLMWASVEQNVPGMLNSMNQALKELIENK